MCNNIIIKLILILLISLLIFGAEYVRAAELDINVWITHYGQSTSNGGIDGDFNTDGMVNGIDYIVLRTTPPNLITDPNAVFTIPQIAKPAYLSPITDPVFGTKIIRIAGDTGSATGVAGLTTWPADARHHYSKDQPWSVDGAYIALDTSPQIILDGTTYQPLKVCNGGDDRWNPNPARAHERIDAGGNTIKLRDMDSCTVTKTITLPFSVINFGASEGNPSFDGKFAVLHNSTSMFAVNIETGQIGPVVDIASCGLSAGCTVDWTSVSPSGNYAVVQYAPDIPRVYNLNRTTLVLSPRPMPASALECTSSAGIPHDRNQGYILGLGHADMTLDPFDNNNDVIIGQRRSTGSPHYCTASSSMGSVIKVRLNDGAVTSLTNPSNEASSHHISTRNYTRPGWVYVTYFIGSGKRFSNEIIALKIDGSQQVERFVHTHSSSSPYRNEEHGVPSPDGKRILFASGWDANCDSGCGTNTNPQAYVVE
ncbi:hypothetical protein A2634_02520 [Candidatus Amesbacteria bacterium RIFCSPHIGHO2_01_FULL_48_32]|uniref:Dockerin domain-containing protein n=1 Tax=Candidatus Amesbacteria bacterium RIFCSPLOWO2_01_FULL_48_25 TaxID=1797259 RepID=A0A1F4ZG82_9BACT|nr:MAG: hypothetical protein A2634_02520 [Candidatus Amesbacteria bacterium RIFCSPHIGHO2_01_FULL_48_32]OGD04454.1 MAG: hypothetical protein A2989_05515 [Candidatus Amesbacteria bacterium RIFCSPLOWO2_01_FULL_48_25]HJZ06303.1 hypothetical protein [Patescibacteria group bacterium]